MWIFGICFFLCFSEGNGIGYAKEAVLSPLSLHAENAVLMDGATGRILYEKGGFEKKAMASTTKIMTCILALENGNLQDIYTVSSYADSMPAVSLGAETGETYLLKDLLYSLMLESHNDSAVVIAEGIAGSVENFAAMMNQKARDIGAFDTYFVTPNGLDGTVSLILEDGSVVEREHSTTAADLARILRYCVRESTKAEDFLEITRTQSYHFTNTKGTRTFSLFNHNALLNIMDGALTGKTGFTGKAGYCYVGAVEKEGKLFIVALLACGWPNNKEYKWQDMKTLIKYGNDHYQKQSYHSELGEWYVSVEKGIPQEGGLWNKARVSLCVEEREKNASYEILLKEGEQIAKRIELVPSLSAPVEKGTVAGTVIYTLNGETIHVCDLVTTETVKKKTGKWLAGELITRMKGSFKKLFLQF